MSVAPRPERPDDDYEARFADIVARWNDPPAGSARSTDDAIPPHLAASPPEPLAASDNPPPDEPNIDSGSASPWRQHHVEPAVDEGWRAYTPAADDDDDDFSPPTPAPLPRGELTFWVALVGLVAGPLWLIYLVAARPGTGTLPVLLAILLTFSGFAALVARSPRRRLDEEDDDGAVL